MQTNPFPRYPGRPDTEWASRLIQRLDDMLAFLKSDFIPIGALVDLNGRRKVPTYVTDATYTAQKTDHVIVVDRAGTVTVTLLETPEDGTYHEIIDAGNAGSNTITIARSGSGTINGSASSLTITANFGGYRMVFSAAAGTWLAHAL